MEEMMKIRLGQHIRIRAGLVNFDGDKNKITERQKRSF